ncbi:MAG: 4-(cytidine 5'-diphospho)-2-C-methyl-D-erythritol kinase [Acidobacteriota bacterium]|nr:MAG: 4-(cytidine 5'-diphospho)-2-C-methyl-D-erythritol kinase [Acidobacteriota bacterium]
MKIPSFAKLNLGLEAGPRRPDGYHALATLYQTISLHDTLSFSFEGREWQIETRCGRRDKYDDADLPAGTDNLVWQALERLRPHMGRQGVRVRIQKRIPVGAGLGGGSSNAAAVLLAVNRALRLGLSWQALYAAAASLGSDVPFFLHGGTALGVGRGEVVCPLPDVWKRAVFYVLAVPPERLSTEAVYEALDRTCRGLTPKKLSGIILKDTFLVLDRGVPMQLQLKNDLESAACRMETVVRRVRRAFAEAGAVRPALTGSGTGWYALVPGRAAARRMERRLAGYDWFVRTGCFVTRRRFARAFRPPRPC